MAIRETVWATNSASVVLRFFPNFPIIGSRVIGMHMASYQNEGGPVSGEMIREQAACVTFFAWPYSIWGLATSI